MLDPKKLIVVLGPHRSGTSLCAAALESLGADLRLPAHYINDENPRGFFEHPDIVDFNESLLNYLGGSWDNPMFYGPTAILDANLCEWRARAGHLFDSIYGDVAVAAIKDPRFCQLFDFWKPVFLDAGYTDRDIFIVHIFRDPIEVALSQQHRSQDNPVYYEIGGRLVEGAALWLSLTAQALAQTVTVNSCFVAYPDLVTSPDVVLKKIADFLGITPHQRELQHFCDNFVDSSLRRSIADVDATELLANEFPQVMEFNAAVQLLLSNQSTVQQDIERALALYHATDTQLAISLSMTPALSRLSERSRSDRLKADQRADTIVDLGTQITDHVSVITPLREQISQLEAGIESQRSEMESQRSETETLHSMMVELRTGILELEHIIGAMQASTSWRLTTSVRALGDFRKRMRERALKFIARFRVRSIYQYQRMSVQHPRLAWVCRCALRPVFRAMNNFANKNGEHVVDGRFGGSIKAMLYQQDEPSDVFQPLISIIVPNFNHEKYLALRLDSIYSQTYQNFEVILLDDASTDRSIDVLTRYQKAHPQNTRLVVNENNSGGVFHQWTKGLQLAQGDIVWIAESDDWCSDNFLETLTPFFENEAVQLAYSRTVFMDASSGEPQWSINEYLYDIDPQRWAAPIIETANKIVAEAFAIKNIIPNASSAIFRNPGAMELLEDQSWQNMRTCGDWIFYLHLIRGGVLAYSPAASNYYRIHDGNTSVKSHDDDVFYAEHEIVARTVQQYYRVSPDVFIRQRKNLIAHWRETRSLFSEDAFEACYSLSRIESAAICRFPNLLMAGYGFCSGGGETFPVELANLMKAAGYNVTYLDCAQEPRNQDVRRKLRRDIPIVSDIPHLEKIVSDFGIDLIHSHHAWVDSTILDILPEEGDVKTIVTLHGMYETINSVDLKFILPRLVKRSGRLIYVAEKNISALTAHKWNDEKKLVRIENALSVSEFEPVSRSDLGISEDAFVLMLISRAMEAKGWQEATDIVSAAREQSEKDIHLVLVGDGPEYDRLDAMQLPPFIHLEGFQGNVRGYFSCSDVGILPSKFRGESFPMVIIECLQAGRPIVVSALGDIPYMLSGADGPAGILVELDGFEINVSLWAEKIAHLASDRIACTSLQSRVFSAAQKFDSAIMIKKHDEVYRSVLDESGL
jgi:glycosyltransferase involved in cell wall biosynthesis